MATESEKVTIMSASTVPRASHTDAFSPHHNLCHLQFPGRSLRHVAEEGHPQGVAELGVKRSSLAPESGLFPVTTEGRADLGENAGNHHACTRCTPGEGEGGTEPDRGQATEAKRAVTSTSRLRLRRVGALHLCLFCSLAASSAHPVIGAHQPCQTTTNE